MTSPTHFFILRQPASREAAMEDVLEVYKRAYNPLFPVICMDEKPVQILVDIQDSLSIKPGQCAKKDS